MNDLFPRDWFVFWRSMRDAILTLPKSRQLECFIAIVNYWLDWVEPDESLNSSSKAVFKMSVPFIKKSAKRYKSSKSAWAPVWNKNAKKDFKDK